MEEIWKIKDGFNKYEISSFGVVKSIERDDIDIHGFTKHYWEVIRKQVTNKDGYLKIRLTGDDSKNKDFI